MKNKEKASFFDTVKTVFYAVLIALFIRTVAFEPFNIPSGSMIPTLLVGDYLFVSKFSYGYSRHSLMFSLPLIPGRVFSQDPERGDVAVFKLPSDNSTDYIKRVIGLPGDQIQINNGRLFINGEIIKRKRIEDFIPESFDGKLKMIPQYIETLPNGREYKILETYGDVGPLDNTPLYIVPTNHYFMMGDNRDNSQDSRVIKEVGFVPLKNFVGQASILFFSTNGKARLWQIWNWPISIRFERLFNQIL